jgi:23S rRNA-/tRNA-specific pseudouridylate synthase
MVDAKPVRASRELARGESVEVDIPDVAPPRSITPHAIPLHIVFEDDHLL